MLKSLTVKNFTVFQNQMFEFSPGLNVIVAENGMGKTHILKLAYAMIASSVEGGKKLNAASPTKAYLQKAYADKLIGVFRPEQLGRLALRVQGRQKAEVTLDFSEPELNVAVSFATSAKTEVQVDQLPGIWGSESPLYLPTRELLTIYPGFVALYESHYLEFEETWRDTCIHLGALALKGPRETKAAELIAPIEAALGGRVVLDPNGRFYLVRPGSGVMEMSLVAEGHRKLAMLARLIVTGRIKEQSYLFWDEPEANLNPKLIRVVAQVIAELSRRGVQIFVATHSFFLMKELGLLSKRNPIDMRYIGLSREEESPVIVVEQANKLSGLTQIVTLDEELAQYDRELELANG